jgi:AcrR family transcriptional regulator
MDEKDPRKKRKSRIETEKKILDAALSVFSEMGFEAASIQMIAAKAEVNSALINRYFGSKSELLKSIILQGCEGNFSYYACGSCAMTLEDEIYRFFLSEIKIDYEHFEFMRLVFVRAALDPEIEMVLSSVHPTNGREDLAKCLLDFQKSGDIAPDVDLMQLSLILNLHALGFGTMIHLQPRLDQRLMEGRARLSAKIFADGLKTAAQDSRRRS